ncbi:MAG: SPFH/Band 7/PHB domain protein [Bacilli bacterium]|nr:SPFH/Band 7/PHB domain protein [Bacilli bacterium]
MVGLIVALSIIGVLLIIVLICSIKVVRQTQKVIVERFGGYRKTWDVGIHMLVPFVDRVAYRISMKEQIKDFAPQDVITKDNVTMKIDTVVFYSVTDPKLYSYGIENPVMAIENLSATTLRNIIGELDLDETLTSRDVINTKMRMILDEATDPWGIKVNRVEVKNILPPQDIREAMERQMRAEREKREKILLAEGQKQSAILEAEGRKESMILNAEADKQSAIKKAEGESEALIKIKTAEAEGILKLKKAEADGLKLIKEAGVDEVVLKLQSYDALVKLGEGQATKIIVPSDIQNLAGTVTALSEVIKK